MGCPVSTDKPVSSPPANPKATAIARRKSVAAEALAKAPRNNSDEGEGAMSSFFWSDFRVEPATETPHPKRGHRNREAVDSSPDSDAKAFVYADFKVFQKEDQLEEDIIRNYWKDKPFQWGDYKIQESNPFLWGVSYGAQPEHKDAVEVVEWDGEVFNMTEEDVEAAKRRDRLHAARRTLGVRHYSVRTLLGHAARVKCIAISPAETHFVSSSSKDDKITMWDIQTGEQRLVFQGHEDTIISAKFSADGRYLATTSRDKTLMIWDTVIGKQLFILEHAKIVICCAFSPDGKLIVSGCQDRACRVWNTKRGKELASFAEHDGIITSVSFSPNSQLVASASSDCALILWKALTAERIAYLGVHLGIVLSCCFSTDGNSVVSSDERLLHVWDITDTANPKTTLSLPVEDVAGSAPVVDYTQKDAASKRRTWTVASYAPAAFPDYVLAACSDRRVYVIDPKDGCEVLSFFTKAAVYCLSASRNNIMFGDAYGNVYVGEMS